MRSTTRSRPTLCSTSCSAERASPAAPASSWARPSSPASKAELGTEKVLSAHHANAAINYGDRFLLKVYRRLDDGRSPELDAGLHLSKRAPGLVPAIRGDDRVPLRGRAEPSTVAVLQNFVPNEGTGWEHTSAELARFYERILASDASRPPPPPPLGPPTSLLRTEPPAELVETMAGHLPYAELLGARTADMHLAFASSDDPAFAPEPFSSFDRRSVYQSFRNLIGRVVRELRDRRTELPPHTLTLAAHVVEREKAVLDRVAPLLRAASDGTRMRIHGDYHLGQVLYTGKDFVIIDFDGDAAVSTQERRRKRSPLRDVAKMMRSLRYAAFHARLHSVVRPEDQARLEPWEQTWTDWTHAGFLRGYFERAQGQTFLPATEDALGMLLDRHIFARTLHELQDWTAGGADSIELPLADILRMLGT